MKSPCTEDKPNLQFVVNRSYYTTKLYQNKLKKSDVSETVPMRKPRISPGSWNRENLEEKKVKFQGIQVIVVERQNLRRSTSSYSTLPCWSLLIDVIQPAWTRVGRPTSADWIIVYFQLELCPLINEDHEEKYKIPTQELEMKENNHPFLFLFFEFYPTGLGVAVRILCVRVCFVLDLHFIWKFEVFYLLSEDVFRVWVGNVRVSVHDMVLRRAGVGVDRWKVNE